MKACLLALLLCLAAGAAAAHKASDAYLRLTVEPDAVAGSLDVALRDLELAIGLDGNGDGALTWGEVKGRHAAIAAYVAERLAFARGGSPCALRVTEHLIDRHTDGAYAVVRFAADCPGEGPLTLRYALLFDRDPTHRGLLSIDAGGAVTAAVLSPDAPETTIDAAAPARFRLRVLPRTRLRAHLLRPRPPPVPPGGPAAGRLPARALGPARRSGAGEDPHRLHPRPRPEPGPGRPRRGRPALPPGRERHRRHHRPDRARQSPAVPARAALAGRLHLRPDPRSRLRRRPRADRPAAAGARDRASRLQSRHRGRPDRRGGAVPGRRLPLAPSQPCSATGCCPWDRWPPPPWPACGCSTAPSGSPRFERAAPHRHHLLPPVQLAAARRLDGAGAALDLRRGSGRGGAGPRHRRRVRDPCRRRDRLGAQARRRLPRRQDAQAAGPRPARPGARPGPPRPRPETPATLSACIQDHIPLYRSP